MAKYIEERPEAIEAIKKAIDEKWNLICMGCIEDEECELCYYAEDRDCLYCPLGRMFKGEQSIISSNNCCCYLYKKWSRNSPELDCDVCPIEEDSNECIHGECPRVKAPAEAEAMLEALVQLLPPEHRKQYGG